MLYPNDRRTAKVPVRVVTVAKRQAINAAVTLVVRRSVVQEASNASTLDYYQFLLWDQRNVENTNPSTMRIND